jgi:hypothetical protein
VSDHEEPQLSDLERRLDAAFREMRPRRGFEDELWARLRARRPWWQRLGGRVGHVPWAGVASGLAAVVVVGLVVSLVRLGGVSPHSTAAPAAAPAAPLTAGASRAGTNGPAGLPFGRLPAPSGGDIAQAARPPGPSSLAESGQGGTVQGAAVPKLPPGLAVYKYDPAAGPPNGTIAETSALPAGLPVGIYPTRPAADAIAEAGRTSSGRGIVLTQARLVYVAVVSGQEGFLEPAYLFTGTAGNAPAQVLVSALAPSVLR